MKLLVLAFPRSGTRYTVVALRGCGLSVGHEVVEEDGVVSWKHLLEPADIVLHQVRYPLDAIKSCLGIRGDSRRYLRAFSHVQDSDRLLFLTKSYFAWHELIENRKPLARYRVEDLPWARTAFTDHGSMAGRYGESASFEQLRALDKDVARRLEELTLHYGYEIRG